MNEPAFNRVGRLFFGSLLLLAALTKLVDFPGFVAVVDAYDMTPDWALMPAALLTVTAETALGVWLWSARRAPLATLILVALLVVYCSWVSYAYLGGRRLDNSGVLGALVPLRVSLGLVLCQLGLLAAAFFLWSAATAHRLRQQLALASQYKPHPGIAGTADHGPE